MPTPSGGFHGMTFAAVQFQVGRRGQSAIDTLKLCAPPGIHKRLNGQRGRLQTIHDTGHYGDLGTSDGYQWYLAVWSEPVDLTALLARPEPLRRISVREALRIEALAKRRMPLGRRADITTQPVDILNGARQMDDEYQTRVYANIRNGHHWSHGLV